MNKITENDSLKQLIELDKGFELFLKEYFDDWDDTELPYSLKVGCYKTYVSDKIKSSNGEYLFNLFSLIEKLIIEGNESVSIAICTSFLEGLQNSCLASGGDLNFKLIAPFLGKESIKFCKGWDEFTGVKTEGLY